MIFYRFERDFALQWTPPELHEEMAFHVPGAKLVQIEDCGHLAPLERPAAVVSAMRAWLAEPA